MDLEELKKRLYQEGQLTDRPQPPADSEAGQPHLEEQLKPAPQWSAEKPRYFSWRFEKRKIIWAGGIFLAAVLIILISWFVWVNWRSFNKDKVSFDIFGPERIVSGEEANYIVRYKNNSSTKLANVSLVLIYPEKSWPVNQENITKQGEHQQSEISLGELLGNEEGQTEIKVRVWGEKNSQPKFLAKLKYQPTNVSLSFENQAEFTSTIISVPLVLSFDLPNKVVSGQELNFSLRCLNNSETDFKDLKIKIEYPNGFILKTSLPSAKENDNTWSIDELSPQAESKILLNGFLSGTAGEEKKFVAQIGFKQDEEFISYSEITASSQVSDSPLSIEQTLGGTLDLNADLGQILKYKLKYRNTTDVAIGPVTITLKIDSQAIDFSQVEVTKGFFSSADKMITWNASSLPALNSLSVGQEGELEFQMKVKDKLSVNNSSDKNFVVLTTAGIDSTNVPLSLIGTRLKGESQLSVKINSRLVFNVRGYYKDNLMTNSGLLPPKVGQKTTYTVYWQLLNVSNDLSGVVAEAFLPPYVQWENRIYPAGIDLKYEAGSGRVTWRIDKLPAATGILSPVKQAVFQIGFTPSVSQIDQVVELVKDAKVTAKDNFTEKEIEVTATNLKSDMPDDVEVGWQKGRVAP